MKVTYNWLKDFVDIRLRPTELAHRLSMAGLEVTSLEEVGTDTVFEIEVTPNRVDCLSVIGIAREVAAITGQKLRWSQAALRLRSGQAGHRPQVKNLKLETCDLRPFSVKIQDKKGCPYYTARLIKDVLVGPSPEWLQQRLKLIGLRPINNMVDITNLCLLETGQPLHAFDYDKLINQSKDVEILIRRARKGETIVTIDGEKRTLDEFVLIIAVAEGKQFSRPIAIAGIMGGLDTEVTSSTKNILLESAYFDPVTVRRGSRTLGLSSESSYRFERGLDPAGVIPASDRAGALIKKLSGAELIVQDVAGKDFSNRQRKIIFSITAANRFLGTQIKDSQAKRILLSLGFKASQPSRHTFRVQIPSFRRDIQRSIDLVEELARLFGYDKIPNSLPYIRPSALSPALGSLRIEQRLIKDTLTGLGLNEIISYSLISQEALSRLNYPAKEVLGIKNPLSKEQQIMRPTLMHGLLQCLAKNLSHRIDTLKIFEYSKVYTPDTSRNYPQEQINLGILITGQANDSWLHEPTKLNFFDLKGLIGALFLRLGMEEDVLEFKPEDYPYFIKGRSASLEIKGKETIGVMGQVDSRVLSGYDIKQNDVYLAEIQIEAIARYINPDKKYLAPSIYPSTNRDLSVVVRLSLPQEDIIKIIKQESAGYISEIRLSEQYLGAQIPPGFRGLSFQLEYQLPSRTLRDEEVDVIHKKIVQRLKDTLKIQIR